MRLRAGHIHINMLPGIIGHALEHCITSCICLNCRHTLPESLQFYKRFSYASLSNRVDKLKTGSEVTDKHKNLKV